MQGLYGQGGDSALDSSRMEMLKQIAAALAAQFGPSCEVVIHDLAAQDPEQSIAHIENGHVTGRRLGDGPSTVVMALPAARLVLITQHLTAFPSTASDFKNGVYTGTPMRQSLFNRSREYSIGYFGLDERPNLIVFGGGSGSKIINENLRKNLFGLCKKVNVLHICGKGNLIDSSVYGYRQIEFSNDMGMIYACADAAVARCGSNSANELIALKIPTLFVPLQNSASRGDQVKNAEYFLKEGLCRVLPEKELTAERLNKEIELLLEDKNLKTALSRCGIKRGNNAVINEIITALE